MSKIKLTLLGTLTVSAGEKPIHHFRTDKIRGLLVYLALESDRPHQRQSLAALFWPDMPEEIALKNLRQSLYRLQQTLETADPTIGESLFTITRQTVQCHRPSLTADALTFQLLLDECMAHSHRHLHLCLPCLERLAEAAALYQGELLAGFSLSDAAPFEEWLLFQREKLQQQMVTTLYNLSAAYEQRGEYETAHDYAVRQMTLDPFREEAHRQVMRLLARQGRHSLAMVQYENCRRILLTELGVEPATETTALYRQIQAEQQGQLPGQAEQPIEMHHFPVQFTTFIGREIELQQIQEQFLDPDCRLLTLVGPGGMGKTRLSTRVAELLAGSHSRKLFSDGVYFFSLAPVRSTELLLTTLITGLGLSLAQGSDPQTTLLNFLRGRRCLLVLDNFEQLVESAPLLAEIMAAAPDVRLLVTSHVPLQLRAERRLALAGLAYPDDEEEAQDGQIAPNLSGLMGYSAVRLFVESARHVEPAFHLAQENQNGVLAICRLVRGMPLALEIAAAWVRLMDCDAIAGEIGRSLDILSTAPQDMPGRHSGMAAVFSYSWNLLAPAEQTVLGQLSIFRGPFSLEAAMTVTGATPLVIARLLDHSLLQRRKDGRYILHELLRQFAAGQAAGQIAQTAQRHSDYYLGLVAAQEVAFYGPQPRAAVVALQPYLDNIRAAWYWAVEQATAAVEHSLEGMGRFYRVATLYQEGELVFGRAAEIMTAFDPALSARLLVWHAYFLEKAGQKEWAIRQAEQARQHAGQNAAALAAAHSLLGKLLPHQGAFDQARVYEQAAIDYYRAVADLTRLARSLRWMAIICWRNSHYETALAYFQEAIPLHLSLGYKHGLAQLYDSMAGVYWEKRNFGQALSLVQQAQELYEAIEDKLGMATVAGHLAILYYYTGRYNEALASNQQAIEITLEAGDRSGLVFDLINQGDFLAATGEFDGGLDCYYRALAISKELGDEWSVARQHAGIASLYHGKGDEHTALIYCDLALPVLLAHGAPFHAIPCLLEKAELLYKRNDWQTAEMLNEQALALATELGIPDRIHESRVLAAKLIFAQGDEAGGRQQLETLLAKVEAESEQAVLYYELWLLTKETAYAQAAVPLYQRIFHQNPSFTNKTRLVKLQAAVSATPLRRISSLAPKQPDADHS